MSIPEQEMATVARRLDAYCDRMPSRVGVEARYAWRVRGNHVSVSEERPNWAGLPGEFTVHEVARFRYDPAADHWTLRWRDAKGRLQAHEAPGEIRSFEGLVDELEAGPGPGGSIA
ncbi:MAG: DUF3024 domain-containing protein [Gemmatimonadota bacterium]